MTYPSPAAEPVCPPIPGQRGCRWGLWRGLLAREQLLSYTKTRATFAWILPRSIHVVTNVFFLPVLLTSLREAATELRGAAGGFLPQSDPAKVELPGVLLPSNPVKFPAGERAEDVPPAQPGETSTAPLFGLLSTNCLKWI